MLPELIVHPIDDSTDWSTDTMGRPVLHLTVDPPAVFARYTLTVHSDRLDPRFQQAVVSFGHPSGRLRRLHRGVSGRPHPGGEPTVTINYLAKDFQSFCGHSLTSPRPAIHSGSNGPKPISASCSWRPSARSRTS